MNDTALHLALRAAPTLFKDGVKFCTFEASKQVALAPSTWFVLWRSAKDEPEDEGSWADREVDLTALFITSGLCESNSDFKRLLKSGGLSVNGKQLKASVMVMDGISIHVLGKGKRNWSLVQLW